MPSPDRGGDEAATLPRAAAAGLGQALMHHRAGRLVEAEAQYRAVIAANPADADALNLLGVAVDAQGRAAEGAALIERALAIRETAAFRSNLGMVLGHLGRHEAALAAYARALQLRPDYPEALNNQGVSLDALHRLREAEAAFRAALAVRPGYAEALSNLGNTLRALGRHEEAVAAYEQALLHNPVAARTPGASMPHDLGDAAEAHANLAQLLQQLGRFEAAVEACRRALALRPDMAAALVTLGNTLRRLDRMAESEAVLRRVVALHPATVTAYNDLAITLLGTGRRYEALALLDVAVAMAPDDPESRHHRAMLLLGLGRMAQGWADYEWRLRIRQAGDSHKPFAGRIAWTGEPLNGRTLLLVPEQGLGDTIQFARYAALVAAQGGRIVFGVQPPLRRLFGTLAGVERFVAVGEAIPPYDLHCPLLSLPGLLGTTLDTVPGPHPYLRAEPDAAARWAKRVRTGEPGLRVGLVWAGNPNHPGDRQRSIPFAALSPLWTIPGVRWFGLQVGPRAADLAGHDQVDDLSPELVDFAETAAAVASLDLLIAVDTSTAHLAGAIGAPVWLLLPRTPDWRWRHDGERTPWYPSMRLFRQDASGTWGPVLDRVADALGTMAGRPAPRARSHVGERLILFQWGVSDRFGWGVYGLHLLLGWAARPGFRPATLQAIDPAQLDLDPVEQALVAPAFDRSATILSGLRAVAGQQVTSGHLVLHAIINGMMRGRAAFAVDVLGTPQVGVAFLEQAEPLPGAAERLAAYEMLVAGSEWNRRLLLEAGAPRVELVLQGVDTSLFHPAPPRGLFRDRFVVFSGGKLEFRKGQDLVVQAFRRFAARHPEALLLTAWGSPWPEAAATLSRNPALVAPRLVQGHVDVAGWTAANGLAADQVFHLGSVPHRTLARMMREADVALFPNRAEGGTNLVAMEAMACGVPTILSANTGHLDLIAEDRVVALRNQRALPSPEHRDWGESDIDEIEAALASAYADREDMAARGRRAACAMGRLGWQKQVAALGDLIEPFLR